MSLIIWTSNAKASIPASGTNKRLRLVAVYAGGDGEVQRKTKDKVDQH